MAELLQHHDVQVVALSKDTVEQAAAHVVRDALPFTVLADPRLEVIEAFGLVHHKAVEYWTITVAGIPLGVPTRSTTMAIPTTLLVDADGVVRWIDQADDYRQRGDETRIRDALESVFGSPDAKSPVR